MSDPSKTTYGERSPQAPQELDVFAFLIGKWEGVGKTRLPDGKVVEYPLTWIWRYILDGTAIAINATSIRTAPIAIRPHRNSPDAVSICGSSVVGVIVRS